MVFPLKIKFIIQCRLLVILLENDTHENKKPKPTMEIVLDLVFTLKN